MICENCSKTGVRQVMTIARTRECKGGRIYIWRCARCTRTRTTLVEGE